MTMATTAMATTTVATATMATATTMTTKLRGNLRQFPMFSAGVSGLIREFSSDKVLKVAHEESQALIDVEIMIYERLGFHPHITKMFEAREGILILERLQYPLRKRTWELRDANQVPTRGDAIRWALQITDALRHVHSKGVIQIDMGLHNVLLDYNDDAKLSDFAGSRIDGSKPLILTSPHSTLPGSELNPSIQSDIFALGSALYEIETTRQPYHDKSDNEVERLFKAQEFPDTSSMLFGHIINKCWKTEYEHLGETLNDLKRIEGCAE